MQNQRKIRQQIRRQQTEYLVSRTFQNTITAEQAVLELIRRHMRKADEKERT